MNDRDNQTPTFDVTNFTIREMTECGKIMRAIGKEAASMEEVAGRIVKFFYESLVDGEGKPVCSLVRFYKTHYYRELDEELQLFAKTALSGSLPTPEMKCLVLLASAGDAPAWNSRRTSQGHKAIPLPSEDAVGKAPMVSNLITQLGLSVKMVVRPAPKLLLDMSQSTFNVFHVVEALGSPFIPAQKDFVIPYGIKSVLGFGGLLPTGDIFAVILFFKVTVPSEVADLFKTLSLNVKIAVLPFEKAVF